MQKENNKSVDYKLSYLMAQTVMCAILIVLILVIKFLNNEGSKTLKKWYKENFLQNTRVSTVTDKEDEQSDIGFSYDSGSDAINTSLDLNKTQNSIKTNQSLNSLVWPVNSQKITSDFGSRQDPFTSNVAYHKGLDIAVNMGTPVLAAASGRVINVGYEKNGYGNFVAIEHSSGFVTLYAHCSKINVKVGEEVKAGQTVALSGSSGRSTGPHLHFEVRLHGTLLNPLWVLPTKDAI